MEIRTKLEQALKKFKYDYSFYGNLLSIINLNIDYSGIYCPTAGVGINPISKDLCMFFSSEFIKQLSIEELVFIIHHEILHISHGHLNDYTDKLINKEDKKIINIAKDLCINQLIKETPVKGGVFYSDFSKEFPDLLPFKSWVYYYDYIKQQLKKEEKEQDKGDMKGVGGGCSGEEGESKEGEGESSGGESKGKKGKMGRLLSKFVQDAHDIQEQLEKLLGRKLTAEEIQSIIAEYGKRALIKAKLQYSDLPGSIKEMIDNLKKLKSAFDIKDYIHNSIKKTKAVDAAKKTWKRPNKNYGFLSKGKKPLRLPKVCIYEDRSGSISLEEIEKFYNIIRDVIKVTNSSVTVKLFHTRIFKTETLNKKSGYIKESESGGTNLTEVINDIPKNGHDLNIILTDGCYDNVTCNKIPETIFIISKDGDENHPLKRLGKTVKMVS